MGVMMIGNLNRQIKSNLIFLKLYIAALGEYFTFGFNCCTITLYQNFQSLFDLAPYFHSSNSYFRKWVFLNKNNVLGQIGIESFGIV